MVNGGYIVRAVLLDTNFNLLDTLLEEGYFKETREHPVVLKFQILAGQTGEYPATATKVQTAILLSLNVNALPNDIAELEFVAIDPPSWYLNMGDASGGVWRGRVDQVMRQVVAKYAPTIIADIGRTIGSEQTPWWMYRQDPKTFLSSLMDWSSSITQRKTQWLVEVDGNYLAIKEQASFVSHQRAFYRYFASKDHDTILSAEIGADNALSIVQTQLVTAGAAAISGSYLDRVTDTQHDKVFVSDSRTGAKQIAKTNDDQSFSKPPEADPPRVGWSAVTSIPEIYSAGDLGLRYQDYIDGRPRAMWLNLTNALLRAKFTVLGHGEWSECRGLGVDTIFIKWTCGKGGNGERFWWATGHWLVYGFHHKVTPREWLTDLFCARQEHNAAGKKVPSSDQ